MVSRVVSTKLTEEEYGKLVGLCSASGYTVSKMLKRAILERMNQKPTEFETLSKEFEPKATPPNKKNQPQKNASAEEQFLYY